MATITFNAFSFLQKKLAQINLPCKEVTLSIPDGTTAEMLMNQMQLTREDVEVVFVNGRVQPLSTILMDQDRVAFVPHGTPGPYRVLLGFKNKQHA